MTFGCLFVLLERQPLKFKNKIQCYSANYETLSVHKSTCNVKTLGEELLVGRLTSIFFVFGLIE